MDHREADNDGDDEDDTPMSMMAVGTALTPPMIF